MDMMMKKYYSSCSRWSYQNTIQDYYMVEIAKWKQSQQRFFFFLPFVRQSTNLTYWMTNGFSTGFLYLADATTACCILEGTENYTHEREREREREREWGDMKLFVCRCPMHTCPNTIISSTTKLSYISSIPPSWVAYETAASEDWDSHTCMWWEREWVHYSLHVDLYLFVIGGLTTNVKHTWETVNISWALTVTVI